MRGTLPLRLHVSFKRLLPAQPTTEKAPLIRIKDGTFYRRQLSANPSDEERRMNRPLFEGLNFEFPSENVQNHYWAIVGPSNAGKTTFLQVLQGQHLCFPPRARSYPYLSSPEILEKKSRYSHNTTAIQYVGFDSKEKGLSGMGTYLSARYESRKEATDFTLLNYLKGNTQLNALEQEGQYEDEEYLNKVVQDLKLSNLLSMPLSTLSNGQTRRARIAKALLKTPELLLLDEPFMGLDPPTTMGLSPLLRNMAENSKPRLILTLRPQDPIPDWITHLIYLGEDLHVTHKGPKNDVAQEMVEELEALRKEPKGTPTKIPRFNPEFGRQLTETGVKPAPVKLPFDLEEDLREAQAKYNNGDRSEEVLGILEDAKKRGEDYYRLPWRSQTTEIGEPIIEMEGVTIKYGERPALGDWNYQLEGGSRSSKREGLWWTVRRGQRWGIFGPNGSGKTTLLSLITSDHPQAYAAPMRTFGRSRLPSPGQPGISLFDIQARIGHSSPEVHAFFPRKLTLRQALESAWADTPLSKPRLSSETDDRVDACLRWFQAELNSSLGMNDVLKTNFLRREEPAGWRLKDHKKPGNAQVYKTIQQEQWYEEDVKQADSIEWADEMIFGELPFSAQRVALFLRAILPSPDIVILDEAFSGMDDAVRDKCLLFLEYGETKRHSPYTVTNFDIVPFRMRVMDIPPQERKHNLVIDKGLTDQQALISVSHVKEEIPLCVRDWLYLPEAGNGDPGRIGKASRAIRGHPEMWDKIWGSRASLS